MIYPVRRALAAALVLTAAAACGRPSNLADCAADAVMVAAQGDALPELRVCPLREAYVEGEPVEVLLVVRGTNAPVALYNHPDYYRFAIIDSRGDTVRAEALFEAIMHYEGRAQLTLPVRGAMSFVVDLNCMRPSLAPPDTLFPRCWQRFPLEGGDYTLMVTWETPNARLVRDSAQSSAFPLRASPVPIRVR